MRATIDEIQTHLNGMYAGREASTAANLPGTLPPAIESEQSRSVEPAPLTAAMPWNSRASSSAVLDDSSSIVSGKSSVLDRDVEEDGDRQAQGSLMASHAKVNLARNIALAQEKEDKKRIAAEREREAERERMRLNAQPVEGLVFSDESDAESAVGDDDDDSHSFTASRAKRNGMSENAQDYQYGGISAAAETSALQPEGTDALRTPDLGSRNDRMSTSTAVPVQSSQQQQQDSTIPQEATGADPYLLQHPPALQHQNSDAPSTYASTPVASPPQVTPNSAPEATLIDETPARLSADEPSASVQPLRSSGTASRTSEVGTASHAESAVPAQRSLSQIQQDQPASPHLSTTGSSRPGSTLGTAFTPATTLGSYDTSSPRSGTFASRQKSASVASDPREWTVDQVIDWGQSRNFDSNVLGKFKGARGHHCGMKAAF